MLISDLIEDPSARIEYHFSEEEIEQIIDRVILYIKPLHRDLVEEWMYATLEGMKISQEVLAAKYHLSQSYVARILKMAVYIISQNAEEIRNLFGI